MNNQNENLLGRILIADDEQTFLKSTAQLLCNEGFQCDCAKDAAEAMEKLSEKTYDLLIADIKMPGNSNLELIKQLSENTPAVKVILVTAYPSQQTAMEAVPLSVAAYLVKPVDFPELLQKTKSAVKMSQLHRTIAATKKNLQQWIGELEAIELFLQKGKGGSFEAALKNFLEVTTFRTDDTFKNIQQATGLLDTLRPQTEICEIVRCTALEELTEGIKQAITTLKESRDIHKSKQLGKVRITLEKLLKNIEKNPAKETV